MNNITAFAIIFVKMLSLVVLKYSPREHLLYSEPYSESRRQK